MNTKVDAWIGIDIGKSFHVAFAVDEHGERLWERRVLNSQIAIDDLIEACASLGRFVFVVDQTGSMAAIVLAVAEKAGVSVAYVSGLMMRRAADMYPGDAKTDSRDAFIIADTARLHQRRLSWIGLTDQRIVELEMLCGHDDDLRQDVTRVCNRLRDLLLSISPGVEIVLGDRLERPAAVQLLAKYPTPTAMKAAGMVRVKALVTRTLKRMATAIMDDLVDSLNAQTVVVPAEKITGEIIKELALELLRLLGSRKDLEVRITKLFEAHPASPILLSMPGVGTRTGARILTEIQDIGRFPTANHLASYCGLAPRTRQSGTSIQHETRSRIGNKRLKNAQFISAFCSLRDTDSRAYYTKKRNEGKKHNSAMLCLARRRANVLHAMLKNGELYRPKLA